MIRSLFKVLKLADLILIVTIIISILVIAIELYGKNSTGKKVLIIGQDYRKEFSLRNYKKVEVPGPLGNTVVVIKNNKAWVEYSPCREKICMKMGKINRVGQQIICVPNRILVEIEGKNGDIDAVSR